MDYFEDNGDKMVSNVDGYQFENVKVSAENDARLYHVL